MNLNPISYTWNDDPDNPDEDVQVANSPNFRHYGFNATEICALIDNAIIPDTGIFAKGELKEKVKELLEDIQNHLFDKAHENMKKSIVETDNWKDFLKAVDDKKIIFAPFCNEQACEDEIKDLTKGANSRCIPFGQEEQDLKCVHCNKPAKKYAYFGKCY